MIGKSKIVKCGHLQLRDWSGCNICGEPVEHFYCPDCGSHWYQSKEYTKQEWHDYINELGPYGGCKKEVV